MLSVLLASISKWFTCVWVTASFKLYRSGIVLLEVYFWGWKVDVYDM